MSTRHLFPIVMAALAGQLAFAPEALAKKRARGNAAVAQKDKAQKRPRKAPEARASRVSEERAPEVAAELDKAPAPAAAAPAPKPAKARVYSFSGLDVNGTVKAPQLLFFRARVQQELDTSSPEKRSFLKELEGTADAKGL